MVNNQHPRIMSELMRPGESMEDLTQRLRPTDSLYEKYDDIKDRLQKFIRHNSSFKDGIIHMAGSVGKKTALSLESGFNPDIDLMLYLNAHTVDDLMKNKEMIIERIKRHVQNGDLNWAKDCKFERVTPYSVQFKLKMAEDSWVPVDLLPAVYLFDKRSTKREKDKLFRKMTNMNKEERNCCKKCLSHCQVDFVISVPRRLKDVIRIIKYWLKKIKRENECRSILSYFGELVVIETWQRKKHPPNNFIDIEHMVKLVLYQLCYCETMWIVWPERYEYNEYNPHVDEPAVLDPVNPFCNVAPSIKDAAVICQRARKLLAIFIIGKQAPGITLQKQDTVMIDMGLKYQNEIEMETLLNENCYPKTKTYTTSPCLDRCKRLRVALACFAFLCLLIVISFILVFHRWNDS